MSPIETLSEHRCFGGVQGFYRHRSVETGTPMQFSVFTPPQAEKGLVPVLYFLAGLTCTEETFPIKAGAQRMAAELGLMLVCPDTSPRDTGIEGASDDWEFGHGAGFYLDATQPPWSRHFRMYSYIVEELPGVVGMNFPAAADSAGIFGHSMGGHGALTIALRNPDRFRAVSAFAPICAPSQCPWGQKALGGYLGRDPAGWAEYDACRLIEGGARVPEILVDQGAADGFLDNQLMPDALRAACDRAGIDLTLTLHEGYDHSYYFISSFMASQLDWQAARLT